MSDLVRRLYVVVYRLGGPGCHHGRGNATQDGKAAEKPGELSHAGTITGSGRSPRSSWLPAW